MRQAWLTVADPNGDTTLSTYGVLRIGPRGRLVYDRTIDSSAAK